MANAVDAADAAADAAAAATATAIDGVQILVVKSFACELCR